MPRPRSYIVVAAILCFSAAACYSLYSFAIYALAAIRFYYPLDFGEGILLQQTVTLAAQKALYSTRLDLPPYTISSYPPIFPLIQLPFELLWGPAYWYGRALSLLCAVLTALALFLVVARATNSKGAAIIAATLLLTNPFLQFWSVLNRIDLLALALSWIGITWVLLKHEKPSGAICGCVLLIAAVYTRQTYLLTAPLALVAAFVLERKLHLAIKISLILGLGCSVIFLLLQWFTDGGFSLHVITAHVDQYEFKRALYFLREFLMLWPIATALTLGFLVFVLKYSERYSLFALLYLIVTCAVALSVGKVGSHVNYLLEPSVAICLVIGLGISKLRENRPVLTIALLLLASQVVYALTPLPYQEKHRSIMANSADQEQLFKLVQSLPEPILADENIGLLPLAGKSIYLQPFGMTQLVPSGYWNQQPFLQEIAQGKFSAVLINLSEGKCSDRRWTKEMCEALQTHYTATVKIGETTVLKAREQLKQ